jgi:hypothetical protein
MHRHGIWSLLIAALTVANLALSASAEDKSANSEDSELAQQVSRLIRQLNDDASTERDAAEQKLLEVAAANAANVDQFLSFLPPDNDQLPIAARERLSTIRKKIEERAIKTAIAPTTATLTVDQMPVFDLLAEIEKQTGNHVVDRRRQASNDEHMQQQKVNFAFRDEPFWSAIDQVLDQWRMGVYNYGGGDALAIVEREPGERPRRQGAVYSGPFRLQILGVSAQQSLRKPDNKSLKLQMEVAWEPRLRPIAVTQAATEVEATDDGGHKLEMSQPDASLDAEISAGTQATELVLPFALPTRDVSKIATLKGKLLALVPGRQVKFKFDDLAHATGKSQTSGGVQVTIDAIRKNNEVWEIHMRLRLDEDNHALESHRSWALQNLSYLIDKEGVRIENAGLETTLQNKNEVGVAYLFEQANGLDGLTWVYETPAAIVELPIEYEFKDIPLP